jgi:hypothetical protein
VTEKKSIIPEVGVFVCGMAEPVQISHMVCGERQIDTIAAAAAAAASIFHNRAFETCWVFRIDLLFRFSSGSHYALRSL